MSITSLTVKSGATDISVVGGTDRTFTVIGAEIPRGIQVTDAAVTDYMVRPSVTFTSKQPALQPGGTYSKLKTVMTLRQPIVLADGSVVMNVRRLESEDHPSMSAAASLDLDLLSAQLLALAATENFRRAGSLS